MKLASCHPSLAQNLSMASRCLENLWTPVFYSWDNIIVNTLNVESNLICDLLALLGALQILHVSRIRVNVIWDSIELARVSIRSPSFEFRSGFLFLGDCLSYCCASILGNS